MMQLVGEVGQWLCTMVDKGIALPDRSNDFNAEEEA